MHALVILNPVAGTRRTRNVDACARLARETLQRFGVEPDVRVTTSPGDAQRFASDAVAAGADLVVAWGGDGTVNGAGAALAGTGVPLGIVPAGSGNGLARGLGLPRNPGWALAVAATGRTRAIDVGDVCGSRFFNVAGIGLDAAIAKRLASPDAQRGLMGYVRVTLDELGAYRAQAYRIRVGGETLSESALFIALANSCQYGSGARIAPAARPDDGRLNVVVVRDQSGFQIVRRLPAFFLGRLSEGPTVVMREAAALDIEADEPLGFHVDGEPRTGPTRLEIRTLPAALRVRVPK
jgi:YegS/Rv2252/BmrU family lipid kinase